MERKDFDKILKKIDISEDVIYSFAETWAEEGVMIDGEEFKVKGKFKYYEVTLKDGSKFFLKMNHLTKDLRSIEDIGYNLME
ncbi:MAG: hypothetical protein ACYTBJ_20705 [Planctomycetota bacterium]|jgi:hypothetical protein